MSLSPYIATRIKTCVSKTLEQEMDAETALLPALLSRLVFVNQAGSAVLETVGTEGINTGVVRVRVYTYDETTSALKTTDSYSGTEPFVKQEVVKVFATLPHADEIGKACVPVCGVDFCHLKSFLRKRFVKVQLVMKLTG